MQGARQRERRNGWEHGGEEGADLTVDRANGFGRLEGEETRVSAGRKGRGTSMTGRTHPPTSDRSSSGSLPSSNSRAARSILPCLSLTSASRASSNSSAVSYWTSLLVATGTRIRSAARWSSRAACFLRARSTKKARDSDGGRSGLAAGALGAGAGAGEGAGSDSEGARGGSSAGDAGGGVGFLVRRVG